jgi:acyl-coenzyme A thioesterase PaaI-like protein
MKIAGSIAFSIVEQNEHRVVAEMPVCSGSKNPYGTVH